MDKVQLNYENVYVKTVLCDAGVSCVQLCIAEILDSDALTEDDAAFLASVFGEKRDVTSSAHIEPMNESGFIRKQWPTTLAAVSYAVCRCWTHTWSPKLFWLADRVIITALIASASQAFIAQFLSCRTRRCLESHLNSTKVFLHLCSVFLRSLKKSANFLYELEVIGRGFLMTVSGASLASLEQSKLMKGLSTLPKPCRCDSFRITLLRSARKVIHLCRTATKKLLESYKCPLRDDVDHKSHYIAFIDVEEFGPLMTASFEDEAELARVTDNLSISAIKSLFQLCLIQMSEFLRRFALCFSEFKLKYSSVQETFDVTADVLGDIQGALVRVVDDVRLGHEFHLKVTAIKDSRVEIKTERSSKWDFTNRGVITTALQSLNLHLQVACCRVQELSVDVGDRFTIEDSIQDHAISCGNEDGVVDTLQDKLESIAQDLHACQSCYDECLLRIGKMLHKTDLAEKPAEPVIIGKTESGVPVLPSSVKTDIAPEDQVFEGYVDDADDDVTVDEDEDCDVELRTRSEDEKEASRRMFDELKTVLISKSEEWKEREARVMAVMKPAIRQSNAVGDEQSLRRENVQNRRSSEDVDEQQVSASADDQTRNPVHSITEVLNSEDLVMTNVLSIAATAAARSRMWNLNSAEDLFQSVDVEEVYADRDS